MKTMIKKFVTWYIVFSILYTPLLLAAGPDLESPIIKHQTATKPIVGLTPIKMLANVTDNAGVKSVTLFYRTKGMNNYRTLEMSLSGANNTFTALIPKEEVITNKIEYYIQAVDVNGNTVTRGGKNFPLHIALAPPSDADQGVLLVDGSEEDAEKGGVVAQSNYTWLWVVGGLLVSAAALGGGGGGDDDDDGTVGGPSGSISFSGPQP